jgi:signal transduction histidine kinase
MTPMNLPGTFITGEMRRNIFLSVKECLHNIVKHAEATKVFFSINLNGIMEVVIHDNGKGIDWSNRRAFSNGLDNIEKRMKEINGQVSFTNCKGTKVSLSIPLIL